MQLFYKKLVSIFVIVLFFSFILTITSSKDLITDFYPKMISAELNNGNNIIFFNEFFDDRRLVDNILYQNKNKKYKYLIIGSSRIMKFGRNTGFDNSLNLGVSGATLEDIDIIIKKN